MKERLDLESLTHILFGRLYAYDILRRFFIEEPSQQYLKHFIQHKMISQFPFKEDSKEIEAGIEQVEKFLEEVDVVNNEANFDKLHWDYTRMLIGPFDLTVPPWESVYVRKDKLLFQSHTMDVRKQYEHFGFEVTDFNIEADDHIGLELDFMYHLTELTIKSAEEESDNSLAEVSYLLNSQVRFMEEHLLKFAPQLADKMVNNAETEFYIGLAKLLKGFLQIDLQVLKELLNIEVVN